MNGSTLQEEILALRRLKKRGLGEKSLFGLLVEFKKSGTSSLLEYINKNRDCYDFTENEIESLKARYLEAKQILSICRHNGICLKTVCDENFPSRFLERRILPLFFYKGDIALIDDKNIAVVGTREPTKYGIEMTERIVRIISKYANVLSGGALGIDSFAHKTALDCGGKTIVFLGSSIDRPYPPINISLFNKVLDSGGLLISASGPMDEINEYSFVKRNQYMAEISQAVIVVEGGEKSGARLTAEYAFYKSIPVFAVPGPVTSEKSYCPNYLISKGAKILFSEEVLKEFLGVEESAKQGVEKYELPVIELSEVEKDILNVLTGSQGLHIDEICSRVNMNIRDLNDILLRMEIKGVIEQMPGKIFKRSL